MSKQAKKLRDLPPALPFITLDEIAGRLADITEIQTKILKHMEETTPAGVDVPLPEQTVTDVSTIDLIREYPSRPLRSIDFFNKGPNTVYYRINNDAKEITLENRESMTAERPRATIEYVTLRVESGDQATVKMVGHF